MFCADYVATFGAHAAVSMVAPDARSDSPVFALMGGAAAGVAGAAAVAPFDAVRASVHMPGRAFLSGRLAGLLPTTLYTTLLFGIYFGRPRAQEAAASGGRQRLERAKWAVGAVPRPPLHPTPCARVRRWRRRRWRGLRRCRWTGQRRRYSVRGSCTPAGRCCLCPLRR